MCARCGLCGATTTSLGAASEAREGAGLACRACGARASSAPDGAPPAGSSERDERAGAPRATSVPPVAAPARAERDDGRRGAWMVGALLAGALAATCGGVVRGASVRGARATAAPKPAGGEAIPFVASEIAAPRAGAASLAIDGAPAEQLAPWLVDARASDDPPFDRAAALAELHRFGAPAARCRRLAADAAEAIVTVTFDRTGAVAAVAVDGAVVPRSAACLRGLFREARVPRFRGAPERVRRSLVLR
jgi:hypothetical protein